VANNVGLDSWLFVSFRRVPYKLTSSCFMPRMRSIHEQKATATSKYKITICFDKKTEEKW
jgi:hypothetical protein